MRRGAIIALLGLLLAPQAEAWRCGTSVIGTGDSQYRVRQACGAPDYVERQPEAFISGVGFVGELEEWYYNRGPQQLVRILYFRNGDLERIATGGHGFNRFVVGDCSPYEIKRGMSKFELLRRCGGPDYRDSRWELRSPGVPGRVDEWVYDFGRGQYSREIRIVDGRVQDVQLGDR